MTVLENPDLVGADFADFAYRQSRESSVTTAWGVDWDDFMIARDLMQNFFDANQGNIEAIRTRLEGSCVVVSAPAEFSLEKLFYLGSEKGQEDVGQYGEGFKAAAICLLRRYPQARIVASSGDSAIRLRLGVNVADNTEMQPLVYDSYDCPHHTGSRLFVLNVSRELAEKVTEAINYFFYPGNPLLGDLLAEEPGKFTIYKSNDQRGHFFYQKLKRAEDPHVPLVLVVENPYQLLEKKVGQDRDRKAFDGEILKAFHQVWARFFFKDYAHRQAHILDATRGLWEKGKGHPLLAAIAKQGYRQVHNTGIFGDGFFAESKTSDPIENLRLKTQESEWEKNGRKRLPSYFNRFGVVSAQSHHEEMNRQRLEEEKRTGRRSPFKSEFRALEILKQCVDILQPEFWTLFHGREPNYTVAESKYLLGQFKQDLPYRSPQVFLEANVFLADFADALSIFLHEHAHIVGYDGDREFTDALTWIISSVVRRRNALDHYEQQWESAKRRVKKERREKGKAITGLKDRLKSLSCREAREMLGKLNENQLLALLEEA